jgi:phage recombination protein Bet
MTTAVAIRQEFNVEQLDLLRTTLARDCNPQQFALFAEVASRAGLDPFARQIYPVVRGGKLTIQTGIDGYRLIAQRSGEYAGQDGPYWCGPDGEWRDVWLGDGPPSAAKVGVRRVGDPAFTYHVTTWKSYHQDTPMWKTMGDNQLAKCAEAGALRKRFAQELGNIYTDAEAGAGDHVYEAEMARDPEPLQRPKAKVEPKPEPVVIEAEVRELPPEPAPLGKSTPAAPGQLDSWIAETKDQLTAWGLKMSQLEGLIGGPVTANALRAWAQGVTGDPFDVACTWARAKFVEPPKAKAAPKPRAKPAPANSSQPPPFGYEPGGELNPNPAPNASESSAPASAPMWDQVQAGQGGTRPDDFVPAELVEDGEDDLPFE